MLYLFKRWLGVDKMRVEIAYLKDKIEQLKQKTLFLEQELSHQEQCIRDMQPIVHKNLRELKPKVKRKE